MKFLIKGDNVTLGGLHPDLPKATNEGSTFHNVAALPIDYDEANHKIEHRVVDLRKQCALKDLNARLDANEEVTSHRFGVFTAPVGDVCQGTPVLEAITNQREIMVIFEEEILNNEGVVAFHETEEPEATPRPLLGNPLVKLFVKTFAKALVKAVAKELFAELFPNSEDGAIQKELKNLKSEIKKILQELKYENFEDTLIANRAWLRDTYSTRLASVNTNGIASVDWQTTIKELYDKQQDLKKVIDVVVARTSDQDLKNCDYLTRVKAGLYAACACLRITIFREELFLRRLAIEEGLVSYKIDAYETELGNFIKTAHQQIQDYDNKLQAGRLSKMNEVSYEVRRDTSRDPISGRTMYMEVRWYEWSDDFESKESQDPFRGSKMRETYSVDNGEKNKDEKYKKAKKGYDNHANAVKNLVKLHVADVFSPAIKNLGTCKPIIQS